MILQALANHYKTLLNDEYSNVAKPGYNSVLVSHALIINQEGSLVDIIKLDKKTKLFLPERVNRTSGIKSNYLADSIGYILGVEYAKKSTELEAVDSVEKFNTFKEKNESLLKNISSPAGIALRNFLEKWSDLSYENRLEQLDYKAKELVNSNTIIFKLDGENKYLHDDYNIVSELMNNDSKIISKESFQCLVTGETLPIARTHGLIKGIVGSKPSGGSLVGFNDAAYCSYGKEQSFNAPVGEQSVFEYSTAVGYLIDSNFNSVRVGTTTILFWAEKQVAQEEKILAWSLEPIEIEDEDESGEESKTVIDRSTRMVAKEVLQKVSSGLPIAEELSKTKCFLLGLSPNSARLSVRFWQVNSFGEVITQIARHYQDMEIVHYGSQPRFVRPLQVLVSAAVQGEYKNIIPLWSAQFLKAIITGQIYPQSLYLATLMRCRTGGVSYARASFIKGFLVRKYRIKNNGKGALITVSLNDKNNNPAYLLGRLFSLLEKVQKDALGANINSTIRDRYFGAASSTPRTVFPILFRLSRHHIAKAEYGMVIERKIQEVTNKLETFPARLGLEDQGEFILGYYHQNQANYEKNEQKEGA